MTEVVEQEVEQYWKLMNNISECEEMFNMLASRICEHYVPQIGEGVQEVGPLCKCPDRIRVEQIALCDVSRCPLGGIHENAKDS